MKLSSKSGSRTAGLLIITAYSMLVYDATGNAGIGITADIFSGLSVMGTAFILFPFFRTSENRLLILFYLSGKIMEGLLMIAGGLCIISPAYAIYRNYIYQYVHIWFFIFSAVLFYFLIYSAHLIPRFISIWGMTATGMLLIITVLRLLGLDSNVLDIFLLPLILNEIFLAFWLMIKGLKVQHSRKNLTENLDKTECR